MTDKHKLTLEEQVRQARLVKNLRAENSRLRAALQRIALGEESVPGLQSHFIGHATRIAREALQNKKGAQSDGR